MEKIVIGNWKMNGLKDDLDQIIKISTEHGKSKLDIVFCLPTTLINQSIKIAGKIRIGAQDCHFRESGAFTGDISATMLADAGVTSVIVGHSERRTNYNESNELIKNKAFAAHEAGLQVIVCVGENLEIRSSGKTLELIESQLEGSIPSSAKTKKTIIAYEPVWSIGSGLIPSIKEIKEVHNFCTHWFESKFNNHNNTTIIYGGSVNKNNAREIFSIENVSGALVGGASLNARDFSPIIKALENSKPTTKI